jgi:hypothetical protein
METHVLLPKSEDEMNANIRDPEDWIQALWRDLPSLEQAFRCETSEELANLYRDWLEATTKGLALHSSSLTLGEAHRLSGMINGAIDVIVAACMNNPQLMLVDALATLYPIEDLCVRIELIVRSRFGGKKGGRS